MGYAQQQAGEYQEKQEEEYHQKEQAEEYQKQQAEAYQAEESKAEKEYQEKQTQYEAIHNEPYACPLYVDYPTLDVNLGSHGQRPAVVDPYISQCPGMIQSNACSINPLRFLL